MSSTETDQQAIRSLLKERNAVLLAHNYMRDEVQAIADITGDSLQLSMEAAKTDADVIVFCGVHFMAESAAILSPDKTVLLPRPDAGCPMADMVDVAGLRELKAKHPGVPVVTYVNSTAAVKAESDICCTSANAVSVVRSLRETELIFAPDRNLGRWIARFVPEKQFIYWDGYCPTHERMTVEAVLQKKADHPDALFICHPGMRPGGLGPGRSRLLHQRHVRLLPNQSGQQVHHRHRGRHPLQAAAGQPGQAVHPGHSGPDLPQHEADLAGGCAAGAADHAAGGAGAGRCPTEGQGGPGQDAGRTEGLSMVSYDEALRTILENVAPVGSEQLPLSEAVGLVLAEAVTTPWDLPLWDNSAMDGYAVRTEDCGQLPCRLRVTGYLPAGASAEGLTVAPGCAVRIMTGAPLPTGADAVVPVEETEETSGEQVAINATVKHGATYSTSGRGHPSGRDHPAGWITSAGRRNHAAGLLRQTAGQVQRRPVVAILSTGDELVEPGTPPGPGAV